MTGPVLFTRPAGVRAWGAGVEPWRLARHLLLRLTPDRTWHLAPYGHGFVADEVDAGDNWPRMIVSIAEPGEFPAMDELVHASVSRRHSMPTYADLQLLHRLAWPSGGHAYQVFVPPAEHVNIHAFALHLWGEHDGRPLLPNFAPNGTI